MWGDELDWEVPGGDGLAIAQCLVSVARVSAKARLPLPSLWMIGNADGWAMTVAAHRLAAVRQDATAIGPGLAVNVMPLAADGGGTARYDTLAGSGRSHFIARLLHEVIPGVGEQFALDSSAMTIVGHSLAGRFALEVALSNPGIFRRAAAISPSLWHQGEQVEALLGGAADLDLLLAVGGQEEGLADWELGRPDAAATLERRSSRGMIRRAERFAALARERGMNAEAVVMPGADHATVQSASLTALLRFAFPTG